MDSNERATNALQVKAHSRPNYLLVFIALAVLTALEVGVTYQNVLPHAPVLIGMSILKALMVLAYFMHLKTDNRIYSAIFFLPFILVIPIVLIAALQ